VPEPQTVRFLGRDLHVIDLSQRLSNRSAPFEPMPHSIEYFDHTDTIAVVEEMFGLAARHWRDGQVWAAERVTLTTHSGTHIDAPYHYHPTTADGRPARKLDDLPFQWLMGDGVVLDMRHVDRELGITESDVRAELDRIGYALKPHDIVLVRTDTSLRYEQPGYDMLHAGLRRDATAWLVGQGVKLIGIDAWGIDRPFDLMAAEAKAGNPEQLWESHKFGSEQEYCQIEKLSNLAALPCPHGFHVLALPVSIEAASGAWARVVALVDAD
jgi:kynurenine formamidase